MTELASIAGLERARDDTGQRATHAIWDATVRLIANDSAPTDIHDHLRQVGIDPASTLVVVSAAFEPEPAPEESRWLLADAVRSFARPVVAATSSDAAALVRVGRRLSADQVGDAIVRALTRIGPGLNAARRLTVGISQPSAVTSIGGALRSARFARALAADSAAPVDVLSSTEADSALVMVNAVPDSLRRTFAEHVLGPVIEYDGRIGGDLMTTLGAYFDCAGSWSRTAERLNLHLNTVRYRVARIEHLTGRDLNQMPDRMDLFLALHLL